MSNINKIKTFFSTRILDPTIDEFFPVIIKKGDIKINLEGIEHKSNKKCKKELTKLIKLIFFGKNFENFEELSEYYLKDFNEKLINNKDGKEINYIKNIFHKCFNDSSNIFPKINEDKTKWTKLFSLLNNSLEEFFDKKFQVVEGNYSIIKNYKLLEIITNNGDIERIKTLIKISSENEKIFDSIIIFVVKNIYAEVSNENLKKKLDLIIQIIDLFPSPELLYENEERKNVFSIFINNLIKFIEQDANYEKIITNFQCDLFKNNIHIIQSLNHDNFKRFINLAFIKKIDWTKSENYQISGNFFHQEQVNFLNIFLEDEEKIYINENGTEIFPLEGMSECINFFKETDNSEKNEICQVKKYIKEKDLNNNIIKTNNPTKKHLNKKLKYSILTICSIDLFIFIFSKKILNEFANLTQNKSFEDFIKNNEILSIFLFCAIVILAELMIGITCKKTFELFETEETNTKTNDKDIEMGAIP